MSLKKAVPAIGISIILAVWLGYPLIAAVISPELQDRALFGDAYGSLNTLFSGLAFAGLIYTVILQKEELSLQRKELELTRAELERSARANEEAARAMGEQVKNQLQAAKIAGLSGLLSTYDAQIAESNKYFQGSDRDRRSNIVKRREACLLELERYLNLKE